LRDHYYELLAQTARPIAMLQAVHRFQVMPRSGPLFEPRLPDAALRPRAALALRS
jgi:hypothetical protein